MNEDLLQKKDSLLFHIRRSIRYHMNRVRYFELINNIIRLTACLFSFGAITIFVNKTFGSQCYICLSAIVAIASAFDLIISPSSKARLYSSLAKKFIELEKQIIAKEDHITQKDITKYTQERLEIEAEEPPIVRVIDVMCHNELAKAMGCDQTEQYKIGVCQRLLAVLLAVDFRVDAIQKQITT